jgi:hypothetical protein
MVFDAYPRGVIGLKFASPSSGRVAGLRALQLEKDPDFVRAVRAIVQKCWVNADVGRSIADPDRAPSWQGVGGLSGILCSEPQSPNAASEVQTPNAF